MSEVIGDATFSRRQNATPVRTCEVIGDAWFSKRTGCHVMKCVTDSDSVGFPKDWTSCWDMRSVIMQVYRVPCWDVFIGKCRFSRRLGIVLGSVKTVFKKTRYHAMT